MKLGVILGTGFELDGASDEGSGRRTDQIGDVEILAIHRQPQPVPPHLVDYVSTMRAFLEFGVDLLVTTTACGSLTPEIAPGSLVVPDDMVDFSGFTGSMIEDRIVHPSANPVYETTLREALSEGFKVTAPCDRGTVVSIRGPRFATKAESLFFQRQEWSYINMTTAQETTLALESGVPVAVLGHVTDFDSGVPEVGDPSDLGLIRERMTSGNQAFNANFPRFVELLTGHDEGQ
jgi:5'-methylthioadenosine phosphorylase